MIYATPGTSFETTLSGAPTGLIGTLGVRILDNIGGTTLTRQTTGITEFPAGSGFYAVTLTAPATAGQYTVMWDTGSVGPSTTFTDDLSVITTPVVQVVGGGTTVANVYVSQAYFESSSWAQPWTTTDAPELLRILERAEMDIDAYLGPWSIETNGRKLGDLITNPKLLTAVQITRLKNAVVCQALWRIRRGPEWFIDSQPQAVSGPDFTVTGPIGRISPQARELLAGTGLVIRTASLAPRRRWGAVY